jgi:hypothetical protein
MRSPEFGDKTPEDDDNDTMDHTGNKEERQETFHCSVWIHTKKEHDRDYCTLVSSSSA